MNKKALYPGSFDPVTKGHIDIIRRSAKMFDTLLIGIFKNNSKSNVWFSNEEKAEMIQQILDKDNIKAEIKIFDGLLVDFIKHENVDILVRGLRAMSDFEYELQFALTNQMLAKSDFETIFLNAPREYLYLSSSLVKEIAINNGDLSKFVTKNVENKLINKVKEINKLRNFK